jgi:hypothetical protein
MLELSANCLDTGTVTLKLSLVILLAAVAGDAAAAAYGLAWILCRGSLRNSLLLKALPAYLKQGRALPTGIAQRPPAEVNQAN